MQLFRRCLLRPSSSPIAAERRGRSGRGQALTVEDHGAAGRDGRSRRSAFSPFKTGEAEATAPSAIGSISPLGLGHPGPRCPVASPCESKNVLPWVGLHSLSRRIHAAWDRVVPGVGVGLPGLLVDQGIDAQRIGPWPGRSNVMPKTNSKLPRFCSDTRSLRVLDRVGDESRRNNVWPSSSGKNRAELGGHGNIQTGSRDATRR